MTKVPGLAVLLVTVTASALCAQTPPQVDVTNSFSQTNLVADDASFNPQIVNPDMIDAWGIALRPPGAGGHIWVDNAESGTSVTYIGDVNGVPLHQDGLTGVTVDPPQFTDHGYSFVTGLVYNAAKDLANQPVEFPVTGNTQNDSTNPPTPTGTLTGAAAFAFVTEDGCINAWRSSTTIAMTDVPIMIDYSKTGTFTTPANAVYSGCAMTVNAYTSPAYISAGGNHLFATDFRNNLINVFNNKWKDVSSTYTFQTPSTVTTATFTGGLKLHPFNIMDLGGHLYVAYAVWNDAGDEGMEETDGQGYGHVTEYSETGSLVMDFNDHGMLNAPWGMAIAPAGFGKFGGDLLVANFGDGSIAAFDPGTGNFIDQLRDRTGNPINIDGIWGLVFGNGVSLGDANSLYFTAGPNSEFDGLFGKLTFNQLPSDTPVLPPVGLAIMLALLLGAASISLYRPAPASTS